MDKHEHRRPVHSVEAEDVLANHVHVGRPAALHCLIQRRLVAILQAARDVPEQRVEPHVDHLRVNRGEMWTWEGCTRWHPGFPARLPATSTADG